MSRIVLIDNGRHREIPLGQELTIGRAYSNLLRLDGEEISRVHAIIYRRGDQYVVRDLDSKNGVWVNGVRIANRNLEKGDHLQVGEYRAFFDPPEDQDFELFKKKSGPKDSSNHMLSPARDGGRSFESSKVFCAELPDNEDLSAGRHAQNHVEAKALSYLAPADEIDELLRPHPRPQVLDLLQEWWMLSSRRSDGQPVRGSQGLTRLLEAAVLTLEADRGVIVYRSEEASNLSLGAIYPENRDVAVNRVVLKCVLKDQNTLYSNDASVDPRSATDTVKRDKVRSMIAYPLFSAGRAAGLIYIDSLEHPDLFERNSLAFLALLSRFATTFISRD